MTFATRRRRIAKFKRVQRFSYPEFEVRMDEVFALAEGGEVVVLTRDGLDAFCLQWVAAGDDADAVCAE